MFDIDGTLTLTNDVDNRCYVRAMSQYLGRSVDDDWSRYRHVTDAGIARELFAAQGRPLEELPQVREHFVALLAESLEADPECCRQVAGAGRLLDQLRQRDDVAIGLATGAWRDSALLKLRYAGLAQRGLAFASSDDAESRTEIMLLCRQRAAAARSITTFDSVTYLGDGVWDAAAAASLGWRFIGIGSGEQSNRLRRQGAEQVLEDFCDTPRVMHALGLLSWNGATCRPRGNVGPAPRPREAVTIRQNGAAGRSN
jgi:phosphoglycolate phosphatase-like HAD superfamily hydrolase